MISIGATYTMGSGGRRGMGMCVREMIRNTPKSMLILTVCRLLPTPEELPRACGQS